MAPNKKVDSKSVGDASVSTVVASMKFWSRLEEAQPRPAVPYVKQAKKTAQSLQLLQNLPPASQDDSVIYSVWIRLEGSLPEIWRRVQSRSITLDALHKVIQIVMGWQDAHLHGFDVGGTRVPAIEDGAQVDEGSVEISQLYLANLKKFTYTYDYEDKWIHAIVIEDFTSSDAEGVYPLCITGEEDSPQEDTGGIENWHQLKAGLNGSRKLRSNVTELLKKRIGHTEISKSLDFAEINQRLKSEFH